MVNAKGLYVRLLIIVVAPIVLLESVVAFVYMEGHWNQVTRRLSEGTARNIAAIVDLRSQMRSILRNAAESRQRSTATV
jgi:two-component system, OmpR family, osmolarity sensor histidine kinase EnvZ